MTHTILVRDGNIIIDIRVEHFDSLLNATRKLILHDLSLFYALHVDLILPCRPLTVAYFSIWLVPLLAVSIDCFCNVEVQRCKESDFLGSGQIASGDLSARTHTQTNVRLV